MGKYEAPYRKPKEKQYFSSVKKLSEKLVKNQQNDAIFFSIGILTLLQMRNIFGVCCVSQIAAFCVPLFLRTLDLNIPPPPPTPENEFGRCGQKRREASCIQRRGGGKGKGPPSTVSFPRSAVSLCSQQTHCVFPTLTLRKGPPKKEEEEEGSLDFSSSYTHKGEFAKPFLPPFSFKALGGG